jgi:antitoxin VapB
MPRLLDEEVGPEEFEPVEFLWEEEKGAPTFVVDRALSLLHGNAVLGSDLPFGSQAVNVEGNLAQCRYQLTTSEIERFRLLGQDAGQALGDLMRSLRPGETESEIARRVSDALAARRIRAVVNLVAGDERIQKYRHPIPTEHSWERILMVTVCARRGGLTASLTRIASAAAITDELRRRTRAAASVNAKLLSATRPGVTGAELYRVAAQAYAAEGFEDEEHRHHQGGACGYRTRDWVAHPSCQEQVQVHQAFAWNPSVTGSKVEETCIILGDGLETITSSQGWPQIRVQIDGRDYSSPDVLSL